MLHRWRQIFIYRNVGHKWRWRIITRYGTQTRPDPGGFFVDVPLLDHVVRLRTRSDPRHIYVYG